MKLLDSLYRELIFELVGVLPVENISLLNHGVDIVLDISDQRDLMYI
jgi:hypothetical protein